MKLEPSARRLSDLILDLERAREQSALLRRRAEPVVERQLRPTLHSPRRRTKAKK